MMLSPSFIVCLIDYWRYLFPFFVSFSFFLYLNSCFNHFCMNCLITFILFTSLFELFILCLSAHFLIIYELKVTFELCLGYQLLFLTWFIWYIQHSSLIYAELRNSFNATFYFEIIIIMYTTSFTEGLSKFMEKIFTNNKGNNNLK